jgi:hypothetical protein
MKGAIHARFVGTSSVEDFAANASSSRAAAVTGAAGAASWPQDKGDGS